MLQLVRLLPLQAVLKSVRRRDPHQPEFSQACEEVLTSLVPVLEKYPHLAEVLERMTEPERQIIFRCVLLGIPWTQRWEHCIIRVIAQEHLGVV
jgi:hypothetical protein